MTTAWNQTANELQLRRVYAGTEAQGGTLVAPTYRLYGDLRLTKRRTLSSRREYAGTLFDRYSPVRGPVEIEGTYEQALSYEDLAILLRYGLAENPGGVTDSETTPGYTYTYVPIADRLGIDAASVETGWPGFVETVSMMHFPEFTISADIDDAEAAWKWSSRVRARTYDAKANAHSGTASGGSTTTVVQAGAGWTPDAYIGAYVRMTGGTAGNIGQVRQITDNDGTTLTVGQAFPATVVSSDTFEISAVFTGSIADRSRETIDAPGTALYLDDSGGTIGTTAQTGRFISFSLTYMNNANPKRFMENVDSYSTRLGAGTKQVSGQVRLEFDNRDEYDHWDNLDVRLIRIRKTGSTIDSGAGTTKSATIDIHRAYWSELTKDDREENITATYGFMGFVDLSEGVPFEIAVKNTLNTLP